MKYIPSVESLDEIYEQDKVLEQAVRYQNLVSRFKAVYGRAPEFISRSPGRVNLIGEHIDYAGFGVLPMAVDRDVIIAVATHDEDSTVRIANVNDEKYPTREFNFQGKKDIVTIDSTILEWSNYFKCGYKGILQHANLDNPKGMLLLVDGNVPAGSGLSSSAAFVCSSALAVIFANNLELTKKELTEIAIVAERSVGVNSGGMDQAASVFSAKGFALYVEFVPSLRATPIKFPDTQPGLAFVIANTMVVADKHVTAPKNYNLRVVETKVGAVHLSRALGLDEEKETLKEVVESYFHGKDLEAEGEVNLLKKLEEMLQLVDIHIENKVGYSREDLASLIKLQEDELVNRFMSQFPVETDVFRLHQRAKHVFGEALRVIQFREMCEHPPSSSTEIFKALGDLMNASQDSCRDLYNCSCPEIDELTQIARDAGAAGSRLTGAGWGGCTVSLVAEDKVPQFIEQLKEKYYRKNFPKMTEEQIAEAIIATKPGSGAAVFKGFDKWVSRVGI
ncbi:galactokinase [Endogone sp. FLAS-F59071]|nr:galactokinase [Endogone sp. FLAS-F59071]|eukprot:RUS17978.1 galactokinase [Endogone sp. FLAS-F59071]